MKRYNVVFAGGSKEYMLAGLIEVVRAPFVGEISYFETEALLIEYFQFERNIDILVLDGQNFCALSSDLERFSEGITRIIILNPTFGTHLVENHGQSVVVRRPEKGSDFVQLLYGVLRMLEKKEPITLNTNDHLRHQVDLFIVDCQVRHKTRGRLFLREAICFLLEASDPFALTLKDIYHHISTVFSDSLSQIDRALRHLVAGAESDSHVYRDHPLRHFFQRHPAKIHDLLLWMTKTLVERDKEVQLVP